ncbi:MAG: ribosome silencing factor [Acidobacteria bacterium]|nr:ribosome silencing factor [Acidobacteriota bacterium]
MATVETKKMLAVAADACDSKKAEDIRILALDPSESALTDYFLICNGTNDRQNVAIADEIESRLKKEFGTLPNSVEGRRQGEWILLDYVDFVVHIFLPERREFYGLERLKKSATRLSVADLNAELKKKVEKIREKNVGKGREKKGEKVSTKAPAKSAAKKTIKPPAKKAAAKKTTTAATKKTPAPKSATKKAAPKKAATRKSK